MNKNKEEKRNFIDRCIAFGSEWQQYKCKPRGWSEETLLSELEVLISQAEDNMRKRCVEALSRDNAVYLLEHTKEEQIDESEINGKQIVKEEGIYINLNQATQNINNLDKE